MAVKILSIFSFERVRGLLRCIHPARMRVAAACLLLAGLLYYGLDALAPIPLLMAGLLLGWFAYRLARPHGVYITTFLLSLLLFLLAGECYLRLEAFGPQGLALSRYKPADYGNPFAGFTYATNTYTGLAPGSSLWFKGAPFSINRAGFRGKDIPSPSDKHANSLRIAVLGASACMGAGVRDDQTFVARLEHEFRHIPGRQRTHILNYGISGSNWGNMLHLLQAEVLPAEPDMILFHVHHNLATSLREAPRRAQAYDGHPLALYLNGRYRFFRNHSFFVRLLWMNRKGNLLHQQLGRRAAGPSIANLLRARQQALLTLLDRLDSYAPDVPIVLYILRPMSTAPESELGRQYRAFIRPEAHARGYPLIDGYQHDLPPVEVANMILYASDHHPNALGHAYHASILLPQLETLTSPNNPREDDI